MNDRVGFSLRGWFLRIPTDFHLFRGTWERLPESQTVFAYRIFTFYDSLFQAIQLTLWFFTLRPICNSDSKRPATPLTQRLHPLLCKTVLALPLSLVTTHGIVDLLSLPGGTEIFHFPPLAHSRLCIQQDVSRHYPGRVAPFGHRRVNGCFHLSDAYRRLPRPSSPSGAKASTVCPL